MAFVELCHGLALSGLGDVDVGLHGGVVGVAGPLHDDIGGDAHGEGDADEGAAAGMGTNHLVFRKSLFDTLASTVAGPGDRLIEAGKLAKVLQVPVHQLVRQKRIKARMKMTEILYIFFGIHTANAVLLADRVEQQAQAKAA